MFVTTKFQNGNHSKEQCIKISMRVNKVLVSAIIFTSLAAGSAFAQLPISIGVKGGVSLTDAFSDTTFQGVDTQTHFHSTSKDYIVGPMIELRLPLHLSVEFDALYRPLNLTSSTVGIPIGTFTTSQTYNAWEFPLLAKYRFSTERHMTPYLEAGPSFRTVNIPSTFNQPSKAGVTAGGGVELHALFLKIAPEIRYTHWASDSGPSNPGPGTPTSGTNQAEFLVGISF
jgi:opacity protein-like surface antigen